MQQPGQPPPPAACQSKVELRVSCTNLLDKDIMSKSDPMCVLFSFNNGRWTETHRSEQVLNNLNPNFAQAFVMDYKFEEVQKLKFALYDIDSPNQRLTDHDFLGEMECTLGHIVSNKSFSTKLNLKNKQPAGNSRITVIAEELVGMKEVASLKFSATNLDKKDFFGKSDPFLEFFRPGPNGQPMLVHRTEFIKNTLNPTWRPFKISLKSLCGGDYDQQLVIKCWDWDSDGSSDFIGQFTTTFRSFAEAASTKVSFDCINAEKKRKKGSKYKNSGVIHLSSCVVETEYSFLDYIMGGCQINFTVAIDFTGSNGDPRSPQSLHFMNSQHPNQYVSALRAVGSVCQDYDSDKMFPALGFGAKIPPNFQVSHEFPLSFNFENPFCHGIAGIEAAYMNCIYQVQLYGPTNFAPVINHVGKFAHQESQTNTASNYYVLLILTDGVISDFYETKEAIVNASHLPMSIIIVGVGGADFDQMDQLDGDDGLLRDKRGRPCARDIVQFVPMRDFLGLSQDALSKCVLAELPGQLVGYYRSRRINPPNPIPPTSDPSFSQQSSIHGRQAPSPLHGSTRQAPPPPPYQR